MEMIDSNITGATSERQSTTTTETLDNHDTLVQSGTDKDIHEKFTLSEEPEWEELSDPIDNGYAWCILTFCSVIHLIVPGALKSFGVLYTELLEYYGEGAGNTAWIPSISLLLYFGLGPLANFLGERYTFRRIVAIGSCLFLAGYTSSAFVQKMEWLYLTYGIVVGAGYGLIYAPCTTILSFYFKRRRGLGNGIMSACGGVGSMCFPYMYRYLIDTYSIRGCLLISGAIYFHAFAVCCFLRQPIKLKQRRQRERMNRRGCDRLISIESCQILKSIFQLELLKNSRYGIYVVAICLQAANYSSNKVISPGQIRTLGFSKETITLSVALAGASEIFGRLIIGWFSDTNIIKRIDILIFFTTVCAVTAFCMPYLQNEPVLIAYAVVIGAFSCTIWGLNQTILIDCVGLDKLTPAFGLLSMFSGFAVFLSQPLSGWLEDATGSWAMSFNFVGLLSTVSFILCLLERKCNRCWSGHEAILEGTNELPMIGRQGHPGETVSMNMSTACVNEMNNNTIKNEQLIIVKWNKLFPMN